MREAIRDFVQMCVRTLVFPEPIYEFGAYQVEEQGSFADMRPFFPGKEYVGCDLREGPGVDRVLDVEEIALPPETAGTVLCLDTLEHVWHPARAVSEIYRILQPFGMYIGSSTMNFPIHFEPHDYWRFTPEGFKTLAKNFSYRFIEYAGDMTNPPLVVAVAKKGQMDDPACVRLACGIADWKKRWAKPRAE